MWVMFVYRQVYYYESDDEGEVRLGGNFKQYENLMFMTVYNAGHLVPTTQMAASRSMLKDFVTYNKLQCHHEEGLCNTDELSCEYMNNCNSNGECINGKILTSNPL